MVLDTHVWLWWVSGDVAALTPARASLIEACDEVAVSAMSCFEVAWLAHHGRITLPCDIEQWLEKALGGIRSYVIADHATGGAFGGRAA